MKRRLLILAVLMVLPAALPAQTAVAGFGFSGGAVEQKHAQVGPLLTASLLLRSPMPLELAFGSQVGDAFVSATALTGLHRYFNLGAGVALHSGLRPGLTALSALRLPLAPGNAAAFVVTGRGTYLRSSPQFSISLGMQVSPGRGLLLGERLAKNTEPTDSHSWDAVVAEIMLQQDAFSLRDVIATNNALRLEFSSVETSAVTDAVAHIAGMLNGSRDAVSLTINAPDPFRLAAAAASAGFPPERITSVRTPREITLQARRLTSVSTLRSAQSSPRQ